MPSGTRSPGRFPQYLTSAPDSPTAPAPNDTPDGGRPTLEGSGLGGGPRLLAVLLSPAFCGHCLLHLSPLSVMSLLSPLSVLSSGHCSLT